MLYARRLENWGCLVLRAWEILFRFRGLSDLTPGSSRTAPFHRTQYLSEELTGFSWSNDVAILLEFTLFGSLFRRNFLDSFICSMDPYAWVPITTRAFIVFLPVFRAAIIDPKPLNPRPQITWSSLYISFQTHRWYFGYCGAHGM